MPDALPLHHAVEHRRHHLSGDQLAYPVLTDRDDLVAVRWRIERNGLFKCARDRGERGRRA